MRRAKKNIKIPIMPPHFSSSNSYEIKQPPKLVKSSTMKTPWCPLSSQLVIRTYMYHKIKKIFWLKAAFMILCTLFLLGNFNPNSFPQHNIVLSVTLPFNRTSQAKHPPSTLGIPFSLPDKISDFTPIPWSTQNCQHPLLTRHKRNINSRRYPRFSSDNCLASKQSYSHLFDNTIYCFSQVLICKYIRQISYCFSLYSRLN